MKLIDGIKLKGRPVEIPDCSRDELPEFLREMNFSVGAEIGVFRGENIEKFCRLGFKMYGIDPWLSIKGQGRSEQQQSKQETNYEYTHRRLSSYNNCTLIRKSSMEAVADFDNSSLDFVYIDGDHRFRYVAEDIYEWYQKIKSGGVVAGHDYFCTYPFARNLICQVKPVVDAFTLAYDITNFYTFGNDDRYLSWMFFKP